tara:strand:+ start:35 stop:820 length:786 start_codon:yes stop_codon:yes gene_type:complete
MSKFFKFTNSIKKILNIFNYKVEHVNSWYLRQENLVSEISDKEKEIVKNIQPYTMCKIANHWAIIQSIKHIKKNNIDGELVECGVFKGGNLILYKKIIDQIGLEKKIYAYDTFEGMTRPGEFDKDLKNINASDTFNKYKSAKVPWCYSSIKDVKKNISKFDINAEKDFVFIKGKVEETLLEKDNIPEKISLLRLDTDFYESTKIELELLFPRLQPGGVLIIDDYGHWKGSKKAVDEYFDLKNNFYWFHRIDYASRLLIKKN